MEATAKISLRNMVTSFLGLSGAPTMGLPGSSSIADQRCPQGIEVEEIVRLEIQTVPVHERDRRFLVDVEILAARIVMSAGEIPDHQVAIHHALLIGDIRKQKSVRTGERHGRG